jgi:hypothetical protein
MHGRQCRVVANRLLRGRRKRTVQSAWYLDQALELTGNFSNMVGSSETFAVVQGKIGWWSLLGNLRLAYCRPRNQILSRR